MIATGPVQTVVLPFRESKNPPLADSTIPLGLRPHLSATEWDKFRKRSTEIAKEEKKRRCHGVTALVALVALGSAITIGWGVRIMRNIRNYSDNGIGLSTFAGLFVGFAVMLVGIPVSKCFKSRLVERMTEVCEALSKAAPTATVHFKEIKGREFVVYTEHGTSTGRERSTYVVEFHFRDSFQLGLSAKGAEKPSAPSGTRKDETTTTSSGDVENPMPVAAGSHHPTASTLSTEINKKGQDDFCGIDFETQADGANIISRISPSGLASKTPLWEGMPVVTINGISVKGMDAAVLRSLVQNAVGRISIVAGADTPNRAARASDGVVLSA